MNEYVFCFTFKTTRYKFDVFAWAFQLKKHSSKLIQIKYTFKSQKLKRCSLAHKTVVHVTSYTKSFTEDISLCMLVCNQCARVFFFFLLFVPLLVFLFHCWLDSDKWTLSKCFLFSSNKFVWCVVHVRIAHFSNRN